MLYYGRTFMCQQLNEMIKDKLFPIPLIKKKKKSIKRKKKEEKKILSDKEQPQNPFFYFLDQ